MPAADHRKPQRPLPDGAEQADKHRRPLPIRALILAGAAAVVVVILLLVLVVTNFQTRPSPNADTVDPQAPVQAAGGIDVNSSPHHE